MAEKRLCKVENGVVKNIASFDDQNIPDWATEANGWYDVPTAEVGMEDDGQGGYAFPAPYVPTSAELDAIADEVADQLLEQDQKMKALGLVMADLIEQAFGVTQAVARQQVKTRFRDYYRALLNG